MAGRAVLALALLIGFYFFAIGMAGLLLFFAYVLGTQALSHGSYGIIKLLILCVAGAGIILWSILPRFDSFKAPGPLLTENEQPKLFKMIAELSQATNEAMPSEVYLIPDVNAFVAQRGGILAIGSRRVMGLGLPLMRVLSVTQVRAVLAHEFGHYYAGDTKLGPLVYNMRGTISRTIINLARQSNFILNILHKPFGWYGVGALRITQSVSRRQEHAADELAARTVGAKPLAEGLRIIHGSAVAYGAFLQQELSPVLSRGARPPLADGFAKFLGKPNVASVISSEIEKEIAGGKQSPYDSHPPLRERLAQLKEMEPGEIPENDPPATSLLQNLDALEAEVLAQMTENPGIKTFRMLPWDKVWEEVYVPSWREFVTKHTAAFSGIKPVDLPRMSGELARFGQKFTSPSELPPPDELKRRGMQALGTALAWAFYSHGWSLVVGEDDAVQFKKDEWSLNPFLSTSKVVKGEISEQEWIRQCEQMGIANWDLGALQSELQRSN